MGKGKLLRKGMAMLLAVVMIIGFLPGVGSLEVSAEEGSTSEATITPSAPKTGDGTADKPYQIGTAEELYWFADYVNKGNTGACAELTANIVVNTGVLNEDGKLASDDTNNNTSKLIKWTPIGTGYKSFTGTFDGKNYTISGLYFNDNQADYVGLFGRVKSGGKVVNVGALDSYFKGDSWIGGICGYNESVIENCYNTGVVSGSQSVGGVCGDNESTCNNSYNTGTVSGGSESSYIGGVCGKNSKLIENSYNTGAVNGSTRVGGVCGYGINSTTTNCYNTGAVSGYDLVGGVCGVANFEGTTIEHCYNTGAVNGSTRVGGVCGYNYKGTITNCYYDSEVYTKDAIGESTNDATVTKVIGKTTEQFASGEVAYLLQEGQENSEKLVWGQTLTGENKQASPVFGGERVYKVERHLGCENARDCMVTDGYSNTENDIIYDSSHRYENGICSFCQTAYQEAVLTTNKYDIDGNGTIDKVYEISNAGQLYWFAGLVNGTLEGVAKNTSAHAVLTADITVNTGVLDKDGNPVKDTSKFINWTPIGAGSFQGIFNGQDHTISGLYFNDKEVSCVGLIAYLDAGGRIVNVGIKDSYLNGKTFVGGVCGNNLNCRIENCYYTGNVSGESYVGGVCGYNSHGVIQNCYNTGMVGGSEDVGGVCGYNAQGRIQNCYYNNSVYKDNAIGYADGTVKNVEGKTTEQFASGEVAYLLQANQKDQEDQTEPVWGQTLVGDNKQSSPVLGGERVYKVKRYLGCEAAPGNLTDGYSNLQNDILYEPHKDDGKAAGSIAYDNRCDFCGKELHSFKEDGSCKDAGCAYHKGIITNVSYSTKIVYSGDVANVEPKAGDFTVNSGQTLTFKWYQGDVTSGNLLGAAPKEAGTYTLVVTADGAKVGDYIYTAAELRVKITIEKEPIKEQPTTQQPSSATTEQQPSGTAAQPPKNGDVITDEKTKAKFEVTDVTKKEVTYNAPVDNKAKDITVPDTVTINGEVYKVTKIDDNAFKGNKTVTNITIGSNVKTIGKNAFSGCKKLKTITIQSKTLTDKKISKKAFKGISKKTVIKVPKKKLAAYKKLLKKKGLSSKNKVKGY